MTEHHDVQVVASVDHKSWQAQCSCGYDGRSFPNRRKAEDDGDEHIIILARIEG